MITETFGAQSTENPRRSWKSRYPVELDMAGTAAVVVGGGAVAARRAKALVEAGAEVTVIAPEVDDAIATLGVSVQRRRYRDGDVVQVV